VIDVRLDLLVASEEPVTLTLPLPLPRRRRCQRRSRSLPSATKSS
jgi:hypothetical protein